MGREAQCYATFGTSKGHGRALLETDEVIFRGDFRAKVPLQSIKSCDVFKGVLVIESTEGTLSLELGEAAPSWAKAILHPKPLLEKLEVEETSRVVCYGMGHRTFMDALQERTGRRPGRKMTADTDLVFLAVEAKPELDAVKAIAESIDPGTSLWIVYPKGQKTIGESDVIESGRRAGLKDVKVVRFSASHTALKFVRSNR